MSTGGPRGELAKALARLRDRLAASSLPLQVADVDEVARLRNELVGQLTDYVLPRLTHLDAPLVAVVGGSTGAGKSTLVNSLIGRQVSAPGVLRPTTRSAVVAHHPDDAGWFSHGHILPGFTRTTTGNAEPGTLRLVADTAVPQGLALVDTPDIDSVVTSNRELATQLLNAADLWLFVTSGKRYADAVPWGYLRQAAERSAAVAVVLDRVTDDAVERVRRHLAQMLATRDLGEAPLFVIPETTTTQQGLLPADDIETAKIWLAKLAGDPAVRRAVVQQTLDGVVQSFVDRVPRIADGVDAQTDTAERLRTQVHGAYDEAVRTLDGATQDGSMLRGEVLARWHEFVGTGEIVHSLEAKINEIRDRATPTTGRPAPGDTLAAALEQGFEAVVVDAADHAAERIDAAWRQELAGLALLSERPELGRSTSGLPDQARQAFRAWEKRLSELIADEGERKRATARLLSFGPGGLGLVLSIAVFAADQDDADEAASTASTTSTASPESTAEVADNTDTAEDFTRTSGLAWRVLEAVFGTEAVIELVAHAHQDLGARLDELMRVDRARYEAVLDGLGMDPDHASSLRDAVRVVEGRR